MKPCVVTASAAPIPLPSLETKYPSRRAVSSSPHRVPFDAFESSWSEDSDYHSPGESDYLKHLTTVCQLEALDIELQKITNLRSQIVRSEINVNRVCALLEQPCSLLLSAYS